MRIPRVFVDTSLALGARVRPEKDVVHYLHNVLRLKVGRELILFNGKGGEFRAKITRIERHSSELELLEFLDVSRESPLRLKLAIAVSKGDRFDWVLQKSTELGVRSIQPLLTQRTEVRLAGDRLEKKSQHWSGVVRSACEQSGRTRIPDLYEPISLDTFLAGDRSDLNFVLDPRADVSLRRTLESIAVTTETADLSVTLLVGPEGGLSDEETATALNNGCQGVSLGPRILRTETAPLAALALIQSVWGDL